MVKLSKHIFLSLIFVFSIIGCSVDSLEVAEDGYIPEGDDTPLSNCGNQSTASYTVSWDQISDNDLSGYKVFYGSSDKLTRYNALGSLNVSTNSLEFTPNDYSLAKCTLIYFAVASTGNVKAESGLSDVALLVVE